jgi:hypothetical protein
MSAFITMTDYREVLRDVARDIVEPELKWEFEVAAGEMILPSPRREPQDPQSVAIALPRMARG